jgi:hypothetical protein
MKVLHNRYPCCNGTSHLPLAPARNLERRCPTCRKRWTVDIAVSKQTSRKVGVRVLVATWNEQGQESVTQRDATLRTASFRQRVISAARLARVATPPSAIDWQSQEFTATYDEEAPDMVWGTVRLASGGLVNVLDQEVPSPVIHEERCVSPPRGEPGWNLSEDGAFWYRFHYGLVPEHEGPPTSVCEEDEDALRSTV